MSPSRRIALAKVALFLCLLAPFAYLVAQAVMSRLGPDPAKVLVDQTGLWSIRMLWLSLAMTPLRILTGKPHWIRFRRMTGLFALFYVASHALIYVFLLFGADWVSLARELAKRPYIMVGALALTLMLPLGITSTRNWQRRLGRRWVQLHKAVYVVSVLAIVHFAWVKKLGWMQVWPYAVMLLVLFSLRIWAVLRHRHAMSAHKSVA